MSVPRPPRLAEELLRRVLPRRVRLETLRHVHDEYASRSARWSRFRTDLWYWREVARAIVPIVAFQSDRVANRLPIGAGAALVVDVRHAIRMLYRRPALSLLAIATLGLGIGLNAAMVTVVRNTLHHAFPYDDAHQLRVLLGGPRTDGAFRDALGVPELRDLAARVPGMGGVGIYSRPVRMGLAVDGRPEPVKTIFVNASYFQVIGTHPALGRVLDHGADRGPGEPAEAVLAHEVWTTRFDADPTVVGTAVVLSTRSYEVVGVMPPGFRHPGNADTPVDFYLPLTMGRPFLGDNMFEHRPARQYAGVVRLAGPLAVGDADRDLDRVARALEVEFPESNAGWAIRAWTLNDLHFGSSARALGVLLVGAGMVLLLCVVNVGGLMLGGTEARTAEVALRRALGAGSWRIVRLLVTEALVLATIGGTVGALVGVTGLTLALSTFDVGLPAFVQVRLDPVAVILTVALTALAGLAFGALPAIRASDRSVGRTIAAGRFRSGWGVVIATEIAIASALLVGTGLVVKDLAALTKVPLGYDIGDALTFSIDLTNGDAPKDSSARAAYHEVQAARRVTFSEQFLERGAEVPGVRGVTLSGPDPLGTSFWSVAVTPGHLDPRTPGRWWPHRRVLVTHNTFDLLGIALLEGRAVSRDDRFDHPKVVVVDQRVAQAYWPGRSPLGKSIYTRPAMDEWTVVGVAQNARSDGRLSVNEPGDIYFPFAQAPRSFVSAVVRGGSMELLPEIKAAIAEIDPDAIVYDAAMAGDRIRRREMVPRVTSTLMTLYGLVTAGLAVMGVYGVLTLSVQRQKREIAVRSAIGMPQGAIFRRVLGSGLQATAAGLGLGCVGAAVLAQLGESVLTTIPATDPWVYAGTAALVLTTATGASLGPAFRAARTDPMATLRD